MTQYRNCNPGDALNVPYPRAVYRVVLARVGYVRDFLTSTSLLRSWSDIVQSFEDDLSSTTLVFQLGTATVSEGDTVGVVDMRVSYQPGAATIANLVSKLEDLSSFADIVSIERFPEVPGVSEGGAGALNASRSVTQVGAQAVDNAGAHWYDGVVSGVKDVAIVAVLVFGVFLYLKSEK